MWYIYVLLCNDNSFYCGITTNIEKRLKQHNGVLKGGAKYTRGRRPCKVIYTKKASDRSEASKEEYAFKQLSRIEKEKLLNQLCGNSLSSVTGSGSVQPSSSTSKSSEAQSSSGLSSPPETSWSPTSSPASETP